MSEQSPPYGDQPMVPEFIRASFAWRCGVCGEEGRGEGTLDKHISKHLGPEGDGWIYVPNATTAPSTRITEAELLEYESDPATVVQAAQVELVLHGEDAAKRAIIQSARLSRLVRELRRYRALLIGLHEFSPDAQNAARAEVQAIRAERE